MVTSSIISHYIIILLYICINKKRDNQIEVLSYEHTIPTDSIHSILQTLVENKILLHYQNRYELSIKEDNLSILKIIAINKILVAKDDQFILQLENYTNNSIASLTLQDLVKINYLKELKSKNNKDYYIYMDYNSTTPILSAVKAHIHKMNDPINPSSVHKYGRMGKKILEQTRSMIKHQFGCHEYNMVFVSSGTEANNLLLKGSNNLEYICSSVEHPSIINSITAPHIVNVNNNGIVCLDELEDMLRKLNGKILVSIILANNETGIIQPAVKIIELVKKYNGYIHMDTSQAIGKIKFNVEDFPVDMFTISGHKIGAPNGSGVLVYKKNISISPLITGGGQEKFLRSGTENIYAISGLYKALEILPETLIKMQGYIKKLRDLMEEKLSINKELIIGSSVERLPNTSCIIMPTCKGETQLVHFDMNNIAVSVGSACSSGTISKSKVLLAMKIPDNYIESSIRVSLGWNNTEKDIISFTNVWKNLYNNGLSK